MTRELYDSLVEAYRESPGNAAHAARRGGCERRMARRAWDLGWKDYPWARPIRLVMADEANLARARAAEITRTAVSAADAQRDAARKEHVEALAQEQQVLKVARADVLGALVIAAELAPAMRILARVIVKACELGPDGALPGMKPVEAMHLMSRHATLVQKAVGAAECIVQLSRLDRGQPGAIIGLQGAAPTLSYEEALAELEEAEEVLSAHRAGTGELPAPPVGEQH